jgi:hypothetical protein
MAWFKVFKEVLAGSEQEVTPLVVSIGGFTTGGVAVETTQIRAELDKFLAEHEHQTCHTVANTIFPIRLYERAKFDRQQLFADYKQILPRIVAAEKGLNGRGLYFERMIQGNGGLGDNQLDYIIDRYNNRSKSGIRRTALQVSIFRPLDDHKNLPRMGFPCLQHLSLVPNNEKKTLCLNAFYATQEVITKAYGNYLGLCRLGAFLSKEMGLQLDTVTCYVGIEKFEARKHIKVSELRKLAAEIDGLILAAAANAND